MKFINCKVVVSVCVLLFTQASCLWALSQAEIHEMYNKRYNNEYKHRISGDFVDTDNNPVTGVTAEISEVVEPWTGTGDRNRNEVFASNLFTIESEAGCIGMSVTFSKEGYYPEQPGNDTDYFEDAIAGGASQIVNDVVIAPAQTIVMTPIGRITPKVMENEFRYSFIKNDPFRDPDDQTVLQVTTRYPFWDIFNEGLGRPNEKFKVVSESELPGNLIYVWPQYDANDVLTSIKLTSNIENCYFLSQPAITNDTEFTRNMKLAPVSDGYEHDITILASEFKQPHYYYIYICTGYPSDVNGYYGKISLSNIDDNGYCVMSLYINRVNYDEHKREINPENL
ncbi:MAG: hypothetical protein AB7F40_11910 [Victivallaceae bacterium]|nr:hypothetical protein [Victivallaceae bacterium]